MELPVLISSHELGYCYCAGTMGGSGHPQRTCTQANMTSNGHREQLTTRKECASKGSGRKHSIPVVATLQAVSALSVWWGY